MAQSKQTLCERLRQSRTDRKAQPPDEAEIARCWEQMRQSLLDLGASTAEVGGVMHTVRQAKVQKARRLPDARLIIMPVSARSAYLPRQPVWVLSFGWGHARKEWTEFPDHYWLLVVSRQVPYKVLAEQECM